MLKHRDLHECHELYKLMSEPSILPYVRHKATTPEEYLFITKQTIQEEIEGKTISRTIIDDWGQPIGTISVFDIENGAGFLGTWIGLPYQGKGYNQKAKLQFLSELFFEHHFHTIFLRIRKENEKSKKAAIKLPYIVCAMESNPALYREINQSEKKYDLLKIPKDLFYLVTAHTSTDTEEAVIS